MEDTYQVSKSPVVTLRRITLFDMDTNQVERLKTLSQMLESSSLNNSKHPRKASDFFLTILKGLEIGFSPMASIDMISIINGIPTIDGKGLLALIHASGALQDIQIAGDAEQCSVTMKRKEYETPFVKTFSIQDAESMGLTSRNAQYKTQAATMLKWRAIAACAREAFPDVTGGLYLVEEVAPEVKVYDDGTMLMALPEPDKAADTPPEKSDKPANDSTEKAGPTLVPKTAGESFLKSQEGKDKLSQFLRDTHQLPKKEDFQFILDHFKVAAFGQIAIIDEAEFYKSLTQVIEDFKKPPQTPKTEKKKAPKKADDTPKDIGVLKKVETVEYDGEKFTIAGFTEEYGSIRVSIWGRTKFKELAGETYCMENGILAVEKGEFFGAIEIEPIDVEYELRTSKKSGSNFRYGVVTKVSPVDLEGNKITEETNELEELPI